jgi:hypothetical protein
MPWLSTGPIEVDDKPSSILTIANECTIVLTVANDATPCNLAILTKYIYSSTVAREALSGKSRRLALPISRDQVIAHPVRVRIPAIST